MTNPRIPVGTGPRDRIPTADPIDPEVLRQRRLLEEAALVSFTATPNPVSPFGRATLKWEVTMPTTVIAGVQIEIHVFDGFIDQVVERKASRGIAPLNNSTCAISLRTPLATRQLGTLAVNVDFGTCRLMGFPQIGAAIKKEAERPFPAGGQATLRGAGATVDMGINSFVIDIPLEAHVPHWFNADIDISLGFAVHTDKGEVWVTHESAGTNVSFGVLSGLLSSGCSAAVAKALEVQSDGFLSGLVGPVIAERVTAALRGMRERYLNQLDAESLPARFGAPPRSHNYQMYDLAVTATGTDFRFCPVVPVTTPGHPSPGGSNQRLHV